MENNNNHVTTRTTTNNHHSPHHKQSRQLLSPLPSWARFYFYGMHGLLDEIVFTALFDLIFHPEGNRQLKGYTTITSFFIYGILRFAMEQYFLFCVRHGYSLAVRLATYVLVVYVWEFSWGLVLRQFDACSWDYSHYPLNLLGLITLLYAPVWFFLSLFQDYMYRYLFRIHVVHGTHEKLK